MKNSTKLVQVLILSIIMAFGVVIGTSTNTYADAPEYCGYCDYDSDSDLSYCNFTHNSGECDGNDGSACGGVFECF